MDLNGSWTPEEMGDPDEFMKAVGMGFLERKAIGAAIALGMGKRDYTITVAGKDGDFTIQITDGKRDNTFKTDGSSFDYESATGNAPTTASIEDGKLVMKTLADGDTPATTTERWVDPESDEYITLIKAEGSDATWRRTCTRV